MPRLLLSALLALLAFAPAASAATVDAHSAPEKIKVKAQAGEANQVSVVQAGDVVTIEDAGAPLTIVQDSEVCSAAGAQVTCKLPSDGWRVQVDGDDGDDSLVARTTAGVILDGGAGNDVLEGGDGRDELTGGEGDDVVRAADGVRDTIVCGLGADTGEADPEDEITGDCAGITRKLGTGLDPALDALPKPVAGASVSAAVASGVVLVRRPGESKAVPLDATKPVPVGSTIDTRRGVVQLVTAADFAGGRQTAKFTGGAFGVAQSKGGVLTTTLVLRGGDFSSCGAPATRARAAGSKRIRRLWGSGHGRFTTRGRNAAATVRGTIWTVTDTCEGTTTRVERGAVVVRDFRLARSKLVRAGQSYLARRVARRR